MRKLSGDGVNFEPQDHFIVASKPRIGAVSAFSGLDFGAFQVLDDALNDDGDGLAATTSYYVSFGADPATARQMAVDLVEKVARDGWMRAAPPSVYAEQRVKSVYFTITRECDLACIYCYQGLKRRTAKIMSVADASLTLAKIKAFNPASNIIVTGGEPFSHPDAFEILDLIEQNGLSFNILCNGTYVDHAAVERLAQYRNLRRVQISLDGMTEEVHAITRGKANYHKSMRAIELLLDNGIPLVIAPTVHEGNVHQIEDMGVFAASRGAFFSPNPLQTLPNDENKGKLRLSNASLQSAINRYRKRVREEFSLDYLQAIEDRFKAPSVCSVDEPSSHFICGTGHSLLDIDWNGDVYPCHLLKDPSVILGNIFKQSFNDIFETVKQLGIRVSSVDIPKCGGCKFNSKCGGGCRAGAFFTYGTTARESATCEINYAKEMRVLLQSAGADQAGLVSPSIE